MSGNKDARGKKHATDGCKMGAFWENLAMGPLSWSTSLVFATIPSRTPVNKFSFKHREIQPLKSSSFVIEAE